MNQRARRAVGEGGRAGDVDGAVVRVRLHRQQRRVHRQRVAVGDDVAVVAGRDVDALRAEAQDRRRARGRPVAEIEGDGRLHRLGLAARLQVQLHHQVGAGVETPRQIRVDERRDLAGRPAEEMAVRILGRTGHEPVVAGGRVAGVELPRLPGAIDADVGVVHHGGVAGVELDAAHIARAAHRQGHREDAKDVGRLPRQDVTRRQGDDEIGLAEIPAGRERRRRRRRARTLDRGHGPSREHGHVVGCEPGLGHELAGMAVGLPRRHETAARHRGDLRGPPSGVGEGQEVEGAGAAGVMALRATRVENRRDVLIERHGSRRLRASWPGGGRLRQGHASRAGQRCQGHQAGDPQPACKSPGHGWCRTMAQPTARVRATGAGRPATTAVSASARSWVVGTGRSTPKSR